VTLVVRIVEIFFTQRLVPTSVDQDLCPILIVASGQRTGHAVRIVGVYHPKTEAVALRLMLLGIAVEVFPQHRGKDKFRVNDRFQQIGNGRTTLSAMIITP
jgi:hypothetical protein